jgi:prepilin-type N-terminal cleavage/methylation domain-containing protein
MKQMKASQRGFTLIELLIVIAIIGILAGVVMSSLGTAREKAKSAAVKGMLQAIKTQTEIASTDGGYGLICVNSSIQALERAIDEKTGYVNGTNCSASPTAWIIYTRLVDGTYWCMDTTEYNAAIPGVPTGFTCL